MQPETFKKRVYKFLPCQFGIEAIEKRRLRISTVESTNDPFEFLPFDLTNPGERWAIERTRKHLGTKTGLVCFSEHWSNPVIWSHYAENHKGICIGFDLCFDEAHQGRSVNYITEPLRFKNPPTKETMETMFFTKFDHWKYEAEYRMLATVDEEHDGMYFINLDHRTLLSRVILGAGCPYTIAHIEKAIGPYTNSVVVERARRSASKFQMEIDDGIRGLDPITEEKMNRMSDLLNSSKRIYKGVGRNDACPCGRGKKYKKCCGA